MAQPNFLYPVAPGTPISNPFSGTHPGIDFAVPVGTTVQASAAGSAHQETNDPGGYGWDVLMDHGDGWTTRYAHLSVMAPDGALLAAGAAVGSSGGARGAPGAGNSTGPHLHFEIRQNGVALDPAPFLQGQPVGRLAGFSLPIPDPLGLGLGVLGDELGSASDFAQDPVGTLLKPIGDLLGQFPSELVKVLTGGHSLNEIVIRTLEIVGGALVLGIGGVMLLRTVISGGNTGAAYHGTRRATRTVTGPARRAATRSSSSPPKPSRVIESASRAVPRSRPRNPTGQGFE